MVKSVTFAMVERFLPYKDAETSLDTFEYNVTNLLFKIEKNE